MPSFQVFTGNRDIKIELNDQNFLYFAEHAVYSPADTESKLIEYALDHPIGSDPLDELIPLNARVIILVDDATRPTPCKRIIPHVLKRVEKRTKNITFVTAPGTHRPLTEAELDNKIGTELIAKYGVVNVDYREADKYRFLDTSALGTPVYVHEAVLDADFKISIGNIVPHNVVGWSGGAKMLQPGICGEETTANTHLIGARNYHILDIVGNVDCDMRKEIDAVGGRIGLDFIVNTILDEHQNILNLFCGHYLQAHRAGVEFGKKVLCPEIPALADIVIVSAYPCYFDYWQGFKPVAFSLFGVKKGGTVIYLFDPPEGLCGNSPAHKKSLLTYLDKDAQTVCHDLDEGLIDDIVGVSNPLLHYQVLHHAKIICLTNNLTAQECSLLTFVKAESIEEALQLAFEQQGSDAKVGIIPFGGETLVRVKA